MFTQEEIDQAAALEGQVMNQAAEVQQAQITYLNNRVVVLRAHIVKLEAELEKLKDEKTPAKKASTKKTTAKKSTSTLKSV